MLVAQKVTTGVYKGVTTSELDELAAETAASLTATHPDYALVRRYMIFINVLKIEIADVVSDILCQGYCSPNFTSPKIIGMGKENCCAFVVRSESFYF